MFTIILEKLIDLIRVILQKIQHLKFIHRNETPPEDTELASKTMDSNAPEDKTYPNTEMIKILKIHFAEGEISEE
ncbi:hypothetical protein [[Eubacterium] cellulosolvens]